MQAGLVAFVVGIAAQVAAQRAGVVFAFWDAQAHLDIARRVVDSITPGMQMLGTVWLPVPHLLMLPFTLVDRWWWNGLAGGIVGCAAYVTTVASLHDLLVRRTGRPQLAWIGTAFVLLNPSLLYLQTTAMTEPVLIACLVASVAALDRWSSSGSRRTLVIAGCVAALAVGTRYDGWFYVLLATPLVAWLASRSAPTAASSDAVESVDSFGNASVAAPAGGAANESTGSIASPPIWWRDASLFALPSALMVAAWLAYNWTLFGDPLEFQRGIWSAQSQQAARVAQGQLPTGGRFDLSLAYYLGASVLSSGVVLTTFGLAAAAVVVRHVRSTGITLLLLSALPFNVLALWAGQSAIQLPWTHPAGVLNLRYGVMMLPGLAAAFALAAARIVTRRPRWRRGMLLAGLAALAGQLALFAVHWPAHAGALREGLAIRDGDPRQQRASDWLRAHYDGGRVLVDEAVNISPRTRIPLRDRVYSWTWHLGPAALAAPVREVDWVVVDEHHANGVVAHAIAKPDGFKQRFDRAFDDGGLEIWRRR